MSKTKKHTVRKAIGWTCVALSTISWASVFAIPWLSFENPIMIASILYGISYVFWFAALSCLEKELLGYSKRILRQIAHRTIKRFAPQVGLRFSFLEEPEPHCEDDDV